MVGVLSIAAVRSSTDTPLTSAAVRSLVLSSWISSAWLVFFSRKTVICRLISRSELPTSSSNRDVAAARRFDRGVGLRCQPRGGVAALFNAALGAGVHNADVEDPRVAVLADFDVPSPVVRAVLGVRFHSGRGPIDAFQYSR